MTPYKQGDVVLLPFPSFLNPEDYRLSDADQRAAGLPKASIVKCAKLLTIDQRLIRKMLGRLPLQTIYQLRQHLLTVLE